MYLWRSHSETLWVYRAHSNSLESMKLLVKCSPNASWINLSALNALIALWSVDGKGLIPSSFLFSFFSQKTRRPPEHCFRRAAGFVLRGSVRICYTGPGWGWRPPLPWCCPWGPPGPRPCQTSGRCWSAGPRSLQPSCRCWRSRWTWGPSGYWC